MGDEGMLGVVQAQQVQVSNDGGLNNVPIEVATMTDLIHFGNLDYEELAAAESVLEERDRERRQLARQEGGPAHGFYDAHEEEMEENVEKRQRRRCLFGKERDGDDDDDALRGGLDETERVEVDD